MRSYLLLLEIVVGCVVVGDVIYVVAATATAKRRGKPVARTLRHALWNASKVLMMLPVVIIALMLQNDGRSSDS